MSINGNNMNSQLLELANADPFPVGSIRTDANPLDVDDDTAKEEARRIVEAEQAAKGSKAKAKTPEPPFVPFPVDALPPGLAEYVRESAASIDVDESLVAVPMLAVLAGVVGNSRRIQIKKGWAEPAVVWAMSIGVSGEGKSPAFDASLRPVEEQQSAWIREYLQSLGEYDQARQMYEADVSHWKRDGRKKGDPPPEEPPRPTAKRITVSDSTVEALAALLSENPNGLLLSRDELSGWLGSFDSYRAGKGGDVAHWLSMHGARPMLVDRKTGQRLIAIDRAAVSVAGTIQPSALSRAVVGDGKGQHLGNGLIARCLFAMPPRRARKWSDHEVSDYAKNEYGRIVAALFELTGTLDLNGQTIPIDVPLSPAARAVFRRFSNRHGEEQSQLGEHLSSAWSKLQGYAARLGLLIHLVNEADHSFSEPEPVSADAIRAGITLAQWFAEEAARVYRILGADGDTTKAKASRDDHRLLEWIEGQSEPVTARDLTRKVRRFRGEPTQAEAALEALAKAGKLARIVSPPGPKGGRETTKYQVTSTESVDGDRTSDSECFAEVSSTNPEHGDGFRRQKDAHALDAECRRNPGQGTASVDTTAEKDGETEFRRLSTLPEQESSTTHHAPADEGRERWSI